MDKQKITDLTLDEIDDEIDRIANFEGNGGGYGAPEAREADERKLRILMSLREQKLETSQTNAMKTAVALPEVFVDSMRLVELGAINAKFDLSKLIRLCEELNACYTTGCYMATAMLGRAILDHVPPIFNCTKFIEVASNYKGSSSFKKSMEHLDKSLRNIADHHLHVQIRNKESLPTKAQVNFSPDLDVLLAEIVRLLK